MIIYPNNDLGNDIILKEYQKLKNNSNIKIFSSIRFEYFLTLIKNCKFVIGNSSTGVREAPVYGIASINIGSRQHKRNNSSKIFNVNEDNNEISDTIKHILQNNLKIKSHKKFGLGNSSSKFKKIIESKIIWDLPLQKKMT